jgi:hypothetical protein
LVATFAFVRIKRTDISIMPKVQGESQVQERCSLIELTIPPLKPMERKRQVHFDSAGATPSMMPNA